MVRSYQNSDTPEIIALGKEINSNFTSLFNVESLPKNEQVIVYENNGQIMGFLHILINIDWIEILNLVVEENSRKQGIASVLLDYLLSDSSLDVSKILLEVRESNIPAINLYHKFNFFIINVRENYYGDENGIVMERSDSL